MPGYFSDQDAESQRRMIAIMAQGREGKPPAMVLGLPVKRVAGMSVVMPKTGSKNLPCQVCDRAVWVGPTQLGFVEGPVETVVICAMCAVFFEATNDDVELQYNALSDTSHSLIDPEDN